MHIDKATKYAIANVLFVAALFAVYRYYVNALQGRDQSEANRYALLGVALYLVVAIIIAVRLYYRRSRFSVVDESRTATAARTEGLLGAERLKNITVPLAVSEAEFQTLLRYRQLIVAPKAFNGPVRSGDTVQIRVQTDAPTAKYAPATITDIDGVNQAITLKLAA